DRHAFRRAGGRRRTGRRGVRPARTGRAALHGVAACALGRDQGGHRGAVGPMTLSAAHGAPPRLPAPVGVLTEALIEALRQPPHALFDLPVPSDGDDLAGDDMHLALYVCCELAYRGFAGVDGEWEWEPSLVELRLGLERRFETALRAALPTVPDATEGRVP